MILVEQTTEIWGKCLLKKIKHHAKWNTPVIKGKILYDSTFMRFPEQPGPQRQKADGGHQGLGGQGNGALVFNEDRVAVMQGGESSFGEGWW